MIGQNTKPSPNLRTEFGRSLSVPSSIVGGSGVGLKGGLGTKVKWKPSMNEDVPSDDSDPEKSPYAVKQRTRYIFSEDSSLFSSHFIKDQFIFSN